MKRYLMILSVLGMYSITNFGLAFNNVPQDDKKFDPKAANFSCIFENSVFSVKNWDNKNNVGFGVFETDDILYLRSWSGDNFGIECKFIINNPKHGITNESYNYWKDYIGELCKIVLNERDLGLVKNTKS